MSSNIKAYVESKGLVYEQEIGGGAGGRTALVTDKAIDQQFAFKEFYPLDGLNKNIMFENFLKEIKFLHKAIHPNIVQVYSYEVFPDTLTGFIKMEYVKGKNISDHLKSFPEHIDSVFEQCISAFCFLEKSKIMHRDIRAGNILVASDDSKLKVIDFGFGKSAVSPDDLKNSVNFLNWIAPTPKEFLDGDYTFASDIYFVGKLFELIIDEHDITKFRYSKILKKMCEYDYIDRFKSFSEIDLNKISEPNKIIFTKEEMKVIGIIADELQECIRNVNHDMLLETKIDIVEKNLVRLYRDTVLFTEIPTVDLAKCFFRSGEAWYDVETRLSKDHLKNFVDLFESSTNPKKKIILGNINSLISMRPRGKPFRLFGRWGF